MFCHTREGGYPDSRENTGFPIKNFGNDGQKAEFIKLYLANGTV
jgi:hypothetical protein